LPPAGAACRGATRRRRRASRLSDTPTNVANINRVRGSPPRAPDRYRTRGNTTMTEQPIRLTGTRRPRRRHPPPVRPTSPPNPWSCSTSPAPATATPAAPAHPLHTPYPPHPPPPDLADLLPTPLVNAIHQQPRRHRDHPKPPTGNARPGESRDTLQPGRCAPRNAKQCAATFPRSYLPAKAVLPKYSVRHSDVRCHPWVLEPVMPMRCSSKDR